MANKKIFISHCAKDYSIVDKFIDTIFHLGLGIQPDDIAYTSREETGVEVGFDIQSFIKKNIKQCDFVFFMISRNYKASEICLNEMGAAWALNKRIIPLLLPDVDFESIGWLFITKRAAKLNDSSFFDSLCEEITDHYNIPIKLSAWNRNKKEFIDYINQVYNTACLLPVGLEGGEDELGLLDYREKFDEYVGEFTNTMQTMTAASQLFSNEVSLHNEQLMSLDPQTPDIPKARMLIGAYAKSLDKLSEVYEKTVPVLRKNFEHVIEYGLKMRSFNTDLESVKTDRNAIQELINAMIYVKDSMTGLRQNLNIIHLDKAQGKAQKRLISNIDKLIDVIDYCILRANELLRA